MGFSRPEYWNGLPFPSPGDLPNSGTEPRSPALAGRFFTIWATREALSSAAVQFNHSVLSDSLWPHGLWHARLPCASPTPGVYSNSCPWSQWCHPTISPSVGHVWLGSMGDWSILYGYVLMSQYFLLPGEGRLEVAIFTITWRRREQGAL